MNKPSRWFMPVAFHAKVWTKQGRCPHDGRIAALALAAALSVEQLPHRLDGIW